MLAGNPLRRFISASLLWLFKIFGIIISGSRVHPGSWQDYSWVVHKPVAALPSAGGLEQIGHIGSIGHIRGGVAGGARTFRLTGTRQN